MRSTSGPQRRSTSWPARHRLVATGVLALLALVVPTVVTVPGAFGGFLAKVGNTRNSASTAPYFTCTAAVRADAAAFAYPMGDSPGLLSANTATDVSGNGRTGAYPLLGNGVTGGQTGGPCPRDGYNNVRFDGANGYLAQNNTALTSPSPFTAEIWFKANAAGGVLLGFGSSRTGTSTTSDRLVYLTASGTLVVGVNQAAKTTIATTTTYLDSKWHHVVVTFNAATGVATSGLRLYVDGAPAASNTGLTTAGTSYSGYWRMGQQTMNAGWPSAPSTTYFNGNLAWAATFAGALTATQVAAEYAAGR